MIKSFLHGFAATFVLLALSVGLARAADPATAPQGGAVIMEEKDVLPYLEKIIAWHRQAGSLEVSPELPREMLFKNSVQQHTTKALNGSFAFAQSVAATLPAAPKPPQTDDKADASKQHGIARAVALSQQKIGQLQTSADNAKTKPLRAKFEGMLKLEQEHLNLLQAVAKTVGAQNVDIDNLSDKIAQLAGTVPEIDSEASQKPAPETAALTLSPIPINIPSGGILGLATKIYGYIQSKSAVKSFLKDTRKLYDENRDRSQALRDNVKSLIQQGDMIGAAQPAAKLPAGAKPAAPANIKPAAPAAPQTTYDDLLSQMKKMSKIAVTLSTMNIALSECTRDLTPWVELISGRIKDLMSDLFFRTTMMLAAILVAIGLSALARKGTRRYVLDKRRKEQLRSVRKAVLSILVGIILFLGFFTDLTQLAAFAGLITAGIAFAMKDMIMSVFAYFRFFGSAGIKVGDYVTTANVTGKVTQVGMIWFHVMEMEKLDIGYVPTGRIVVFANSVLFQPTPFFRQTQGTNFTWSEISIVLSPTADQEAAYKKLVDVVQKVHAKHRDAITRHETAIQKIAQIKASLAAPMTYLKMTSVGLTMVIRYAVERDQEAALYQQMMDAIILSTKKDQTIKVAFVG